MTTRTKQVVWLVALLAGAPWQARAQALLVPTLGGALGGDAADTSGVVYAVSVGYWASEPFGVDVEVAHLPEFFLARPDLVEQAAGGLTTLAFNLVLGTSARPGTVARMRPYVSGGPVLFRFWPEDTGNVVCRTTATLGLDVGGGLLASFTDHMGVRFDARYFWNPHQGGSQTVCGETTIDRFSGVDFSRASVGFAWRF